MLRNDFAIARLAMTQVRKGKISDFMPWPKQEEEPASPEQVLAFLKSRVQKK
jgi:hypothetical protein